MTTTKLDIQKFREDGLLQEVNRQFFHPMGLALAINTGFKDKAELETWLMERGVFHFQQHDIQSVWVFVCIMGLNKPYLDSILDDDDPEGWRYKCLTPEEVQDSLDKVEKVKQRLDSFIETRTEALGYVVQPPEDFATGVEV